MTAAWYAAYGSNTDESRFAQYLERCTQPAVPLASRPHVLDLPLFFARAATARWGPGGVAFVGTERDVSPTTLVRLWLLPVDCLAEIGAMENGQPPARGTLDLDTAVTHGAAPALDGWYDAWVHCGEVDGHPVVTLTTTAAPAPNPPGRAYATVVARGLRATHRLSAEEVARYLAPRAGLPEVVLLEWQLAGGRYPGAE